MPMQKNDPAQDRKVSMTDVWRPDFNNVSLYDDFDHLHELYKVNKLTRYEFETLVMRLRIFDEQSFYLEKTQDHQSELIQKLSNISAAIEGY